MGAVLSEQGLPLHALLIPTLANLLPIPPPPTGGENRLQGIHFMTEEQSWGATTIPSAYHASLGPPQGVLRATCAPQGKWKFYRATPVRIPRCGTPLPRWGEFSKGESSSCAYPAAGPVAFRRSTRPLPLRCLLQSKCCILLFTHFLSYFPTIHTGRSMLDGTCIEF